MKIIVRKKLSDEDIPIYAAVHASFVFRGIAERYKVAQVSYENEVLTVECVRVV